MDATWYTMRFGYMMCNCVTVYLLISTTIIMRGETQVTTQIVSSQVEVKSKMQCFLQLHARRNSRKKTQ